MVIFTKIILTEKNEVLKEEDEEPFLTQIQKFNNSKIQVAK